MYFPACNCNTDGSETLQCDRRTGQCQCIVGVAGNKCDRCARGTTGELPYCVPCGECFDNWDDIIQDLKSECSVILVVYDYTAYITTFLTKCTSSIKATPLLWPLWLHISDSLCRWGPLYQKTMTKGVVYIWRLFELFFWVPIHY